MSEPLTAKEIEAIRGRVAAYWQPGPTNDDTPRQRAHDRAALLATLDAAREGQGLRARLHAALDDAFGDDWEQAIPADEVHAIVDHVLIPEPPPPDHLVDAYFRSVAALAAQQREGAGQ